MLKFAIEFIKPKKITAILLANILLCSIFLSYFYISFSEASDFSAPHPFTAEEAVLIKKGLIKMEGLPENVFDTSLINSPVLNPQEDNDGDGLLNSEELLVYEKNGKKYLQYKSHPLLKDTDGDGMYDKEDPDPLSWNIIARDAILFQELSYRDDDYIDQVLDYTKINTSLPLYKGREHYELMRKELSPFWIARKHWHDSNGFDATLFTFSNKTFPWLKDKSTNILAIRGTSDAKDILVDTQLISGIWTSQADSVLRVAEELSVNPEEYKNLSVTGHSLGGYLAQLFMVKVVGKKYGYTYGNSYGKDWNWHDKAKYDNPEFRNLYAFNAPRIFTRVSWLAGWLGEYYHLAAYLDKNRKDENNKPRSVYYQVDNDSTIPAYPDAVTKIGISANGHSSLSFFEEKFQSIDGFKLNWRSGLSSVGEIAPNLSVIDLGKMTVLEFVDAETSKTIDKVNVSFKESEANKFNILDYIPQGYSLVSSVPIKYNDHNKIQVQKTKYTITYNFIENDNIVATKVIETYYEDNNFELPTIPVSDDENYEYVLANGPIYKPKAEEIVENKIYTVKLLKKEKEITTDVIFVDENNKTLSSYTVVSKAGDKSELKVDESKIPAAYILAKDNDIVLLKGQENRVKLKKREFIVTYKYIDITNNEVLKKETETVKYGEASQYSLAIPDNYILAENYIFVLPDKVNSDTEVEILVQKKVADLEIKTFKLVLKYPTGKKLNLHTVSLTRDDVINSDPKTVIKISIPSHPKSEEGFYYVFESGSDDLLSKEITIDETIWNKASKDDINEITVNLIEKQKKIEPVIFTVHWKMIDVDNKKILNHGVLEIEKNKAWILNLPQDSNGEYSFVDSLPNIDKDYPENAALIIPVKFKPYVYKVQLQYVYVSSANVETILRQEIQNVEASKKAKLYDEHIPYGTKGHYYEINPDFENPQINSDGVLKIPMNLVKIKYKFKVNFVDISNPEVALPSKESELEAGTIVDYVLPDLKIYDPLFDGVYVLNSEVPSFELLKDTEINLKLRRVKNVYPVELIFVNSNDQILSSKRLLLESGSAISYDISDIQELKDYRIKKEPPSFIINKDNAEQYKTVKIIMAHVIPASVIGPANPRQTSVAPPPIEHPTKLPVPTLPINPPVEPTEPVAPPQPPKEAILSVDHLLPVLDINMVKDLSGQLIKDKQPNTASFQKTNIFDFVINLFIL